MEMVARGGKVEMGAAPLGAFGTLEKNFAEIENI